MDFANTHITIQYACTGYYTIIMLYLHIYIHIHTHTYYYTFFSLYYILIVHELLDSEQESTGIPSNRIIIGEYITLSLSLSPSPPHPKDNHHFDFRWYFSRWCSCHVLCPDLQQASGWYFSSQLLASTAQRTAGGNVPCFDMVILEEMWQRSSVTVHLCSFQIISTSMNDFSDCMHYVFICHNMIPNKYSTEEKLIIWIPSVAYTMHF